MADLQDSALMRSILNAQPTPKTSDNSPAASVEGSVRARANKYRLSWDEPIQGHAACKMASTVTVLGGGGVCGHRRERTGCGESEGGGGCAVHRKRDRTERLIVG